MYIETRRRLGADTIEINRYGFGRFGGPGKQRKPRIKKQTEQAKEKNRKVRARHIQRLMLHNFKPGDLHVILQYRKEDRPETYEQGMARIRAFLKRIRKYYKDRGYECKYIAVTERGKKRAVLHHHIIIEAIDDNHMHTIPAITSCWSGYVKTSVMYEDGNFEQLADYLVKAAGKEECTGATYIRSRNLKEPVKEKAIVFKKSFDRDPVAPEGWILDKESLVNGVNRYNGKAYQRYFLKRAKSTKTDGIDTKMSVNVSKAQKGAPFEIKIGFWDRIRKAAGRILRR